MYGVSYQAGDGLEEDGHVDGFGYMGVHASFEGILLIFLEGIGGHSYDGYICFYGIAEFADSACGIVAIHARHLDIHEDESERAGWFVLYALQALLSVFDPGDMESVVFEQLGSDLRIEFVIFRQQQWASIELIGILLLYFAGE